MLIDLVSLGRLQRDLIVNTYPNDGQAKQADFESDDHGGQDQSDPTVGAPFKCRISSYEGDEREYSDAVRLRLVYNLFYPSSVVLDSFSHVTVDGTDYKISRISRPSDVANVENSAILIIVT